MIKFIFILVIITPTGEFRVDSSVVDQCPEKTLFTAQMEQQRINQTIIDWNARCYRLDVGAMFGNQS